MPLFSSFPVRYHQQNTREFCGPTSAMMIVDALHGGLIQEEVWWPAVESSSKDWDTDPNSLERGLNTPPPSPFKNLFVAVLAGNEPDGTRAIVETLVTPGAGPVAALIFRKSHWVVVSSVSLTAAPGTTVVPAIWGFYLNSPSLTPLNPPVAHNNGDSCGTAVTFGSTEANQYVDYGTWKTHDFNGFPNGGKAVFAVVCAKKRTSIAKLSPQPAGGAPPPVPPPAPAPGGAQQKSEVRTFVLPDAAKREALTAIAEHGLAEGPLSDAVRNVVAGEPVVVHRTDLGESYYYLIPLVRARVVVGIARTDALHGQFMGAAAAREAKFHVRTTEEVQRELPGFQVDELVWEPCQESTSPYSPFHRVIGSRGECAYVDQLGHVFRSLTPLRGGD